MTQIMFNLHRLGKDLSMISSRKICLVSAIVVLVAGCHTERVRQLTYPPDFKYIEKKDLSSAMFKFALGVTTLNDVIEQGDATAGIHQAEVVQELKKLEAITDQIRGSTGSTNHPLIDEHIAEFTAELSRARVAAEKNPPNYYGAGRIAGACQYCHGGFPTLNQNRKE